MIYIDAHNYLKRIYHGGGNPYGLFYNMMVKYQDQAGVQLVCDTATSRNYRKEIHPWYKAGRDQGDDPIYWEVYQNCKELANLFPNVKVVDVTVGEADDYISCRALEGDSVISNDKDLWWLMEQGTTILLNATTKVDRELIEIKFDACPRHIQLYKTLVGDTSDKIPGKRGFGKAAWAKMSYEDRELYTHYFKRHFTKDNIKPEAWDPDIMTEQALMSWQLAIPYCAYGFIVIDKESNVTPLQFIEEKGIVL